MTQPPFPGNDFFDQIDSVARNLTGNAFRLKRDDPDAPQKFTEFVAQSEQEFSAIQQPTAQPQSFRDFEQGGFQQPTELEMLTAAAEARIAAQSEQQPTFAGGEPLPSLFDQTLGRAAGAAGRGLLGIGRTHLEAFEDIVPALAAVGSYGVANALDTITGVPFIGDDIRDQFEFLKKYEAAKEVQREIDRAGSFTEKAGRFFNPLASTGSRALSDPELRGSAYQVPIYTGDTIDPAFHISALDIAEGFLDPANIIPVVGKLGYLERLEQPARRTFREVMQEGGQSFAEEAARARTATGRGVTQAAEAIGRTGVDPIRRELARIGNPPRVSLEDVADASTLPPRRPRTPEVREGLIEYTRDEFIPIDDPRVAPSGSIINDIISDPSRAGQKFRYDTLSGGVRQGVIGADGTIIPLPNRYSGAIPNWWTLDENRQISRGKRALIDRIGLEVRKHTPSRPDFFGESRIGGAGIPPDVGEVAEIFIRSLPDETLDDLGSSYFSARAFDFGDAQASVGFYDTDQGLINIALGALDDGIQPERIIPHEVTHHLKQFITDDEYKQFVDLFKRDLASGGDDMLRRADEIIAETGEKVKPRRPATAEEVQLVKDAYRFRSFDEFFAEVLTDKVLRDIYERSLRNPERAAFHKILDKVKDFGVALYNVFTRRGQPDIAERVYQRFVLGNIDVSKRQEFTEGILRQGADIPEDAAAAARGAGVGGQRLNEIRAEMKSLMGDGNRLTPEQGTRFEELAKEANSIQFDRVKPLDISKVKPAAERLSTLSTDEVLVARNALTEDKNVYLAITEAAAGTRNAAPTVLDDIVSGANQVVSLEKLYDTFAPIRSLLRQKHGETIRLYRATGKQIDKPTTNWASTREGALQYGTDIIERDVPIDDILAVNVGLNGNYEEFVISSIRPTAARGIPEAPAPVARGVVGVPTGAGSTLDEFYPLVGDTVDGRTTSTKVDNFDSVSATYSSFEEVPGIREMDLRSWGGEGGFVTRSDIEQVDELAKAIRESNHIDPVIIGVGKNGEPVVIEGAHRVAAMQKLGANSIPVKLVVDTTDASLDEVAIAVRRGEEALTLPAPVARQADVAARLTPEQQIEAEVAAIRRGGGGGAAPPDVQVAPLPGGVPDLTDFGEQLGITFREGKFGFKIPGTNKQIELSKFTPRKAGEFLRLGALDPSLRATRIGQRLGHILNPLIDEGKNLADRAFSYVDEIGTREGLFGRLNDRGQFETSKAGPLQGLSLNDADRPEILRLLNPEQREFVDRLRQLSKASLDLRNRAGAGVNPITETEKILFLSRGIVAKRNKAGEIIALKEAPQVRPGGRGLGGKVSMEKGRVLETMEDVREQGYDVVPYDQRVRDQLRAAYRANAEEALVKYVKENFDTVPAGSTFEDATKLPFQNHNILIRGREGQQIASDLTEALADQAKRAGSVVSGIAKINSVSRYFALAGDASISTIQLIITAFGHKKAYLKALAAFADALAKGIVSPELATKSNAARIQRSLKLANRHSTLKLGGGEFTEAFNPEGVLGATDLWNEALSVRGAAQRVKAIPRRLLEPFRIATEAAFDEAGLSMAEGLESLAKNADGTFDTAVLKDIDDYINNTRGLMSSSRIGVNQATRTGESAILLASQYRRATGAFYSSMLQGGIKGDLARKSMFKMITGMMMLGAGIEILMGIENGDSPQKIGQGVKERLNPLHPRFLLWEVAGQLVGPGSKLLSDMRLLSKMANDPEGFMETKEWGSNNFVNWVRGQLAFASGLPINLLLGKDAGGNPMGEGWGLLAKILTGNFIPLTANAAFFSGGPNDTSQGKAARGISDFVGGRSFPAGAFDYLNNASDLTWGMKYVDTEPYQKKITRRSQAAMLDPITEERAAGGDKVSTYYSEAKKIDDTRLRQEKSIIDGLAGRGPLAGIVTRKPFPTAPQRSALDLYYEAQSNARNQKVGLAAGAGMDFDENKEEETDANIDALEAYNLTFDNAIVGDFFMPDVWNKLVTKLLASLPKEQKEYVRRNTNQGVHAPGIMELLKGSTSAKRIIESQAARVAHSGKREATTLGITEPQQLRGRGGQALPQAPPAFGSFQGSINAPTSE